MSIAAPYDWLRQLPKSVLEKDEAPWFGASPSFPWEQFAAIIAKIFQVEEVSLSPLAWEYRSEAGLFEGLGSKVLPLHVELAPLKGLFTFAMAERDVERLMNLLLTGTGDATTLIDPDYREGFYQFLALEVFNVFSRLEIGQGLVPHLLEEVSAPLTASLCQDLVIDVKGSTFIGRLIVSDDLRRSWKEHYADYSLHQVVPAELQVVVHLEGGSVVLSQEEWKNVNIGDCVLLDHCTLEGSSDKGKILVKLNGRPVYRARIKDGSIKILESPFFHEVETSLTPTHNQEAKLPDTFDEEFTDFDDEADFSDFDDETEEYDDEHTDVHTDLDEHHDDQEYQEESDETQDEEAHAPVANEAPKVSVADIPLTIVVEVGRLQISVQKFMDLQPGNLLDLDIHPEKGVDLVVNGNLVAKGELLKVGDTLGVRILDKA